MLQNNPKLKSLIDKLWNKFWSGGIANPLTAIEQITYLIFMKRLDDQDMQRKRDLADGYIDHYDSIFQGTFKLNPNDKKEQGVERETLRWSYFKQLKAEAMLNHIQQYVFPFLKRLNGENKQFTDSMQHAVFIIPSPSLLVEAINIIEDIFIEIKKDAENSKQHFQDIQGDVYEMLLSEIATAGKMGQFRTPRHIIKLLSELVLHDLRIDFQDFKIGDPACGTGGFLLGAYQYIISSLDKDGKFAQVDEDGFSRSSTAPTFSHNIKMNLDRSLHGYDIDPTMVRLGLMNLMMHGIDNPQIQYKDTLSKNFDHSELNQYNVILANPPFTGSLNKGEIDSESLSLNTTKTELLFIDRIHTMLRKGGIAGIIIPQGVLFGTGKAFVEARKIMIDQSELKAVISMPSGVFKPYAGVATAILIFTKASVTENVWFYNMEADGYSLDDKRKKIEQSDLQDIIEKYKVKENHTENNRNAKHFFVTKSEIIENNYDLSFNTYKEEAYAEIEYDEPKDILEKLGEIESQIQDELKQIKSLII